MVDFAEIEIMRKANAGSGSNGSGGGTSSSGNAGSNDGSSAMGDARPENNGQSDFASTATATSNNTASGQADSSTQTESKERSVPGEAASKSEIQPERDMAREAEIAAQNLAHTRGISGREKEELVFAARTAGQFGGREADIQAIAADTHLKVIGRPIEQAAQPAQPDYLAQAVAAARGTGISGIIHNVVHDTGHQFAKQTGGEQKRDTGLDTVGLG